MEGTGCLVPRIVNGRSVVEWQGREWYVGGELAQMANKETFNFYRSMQRQGVRIYKFIHNKEMTKHFRGWTLLLPLTKVEN